MKSDADGGGVTGLLNGSRDRSSDFERLLLVTGLVTLLSNSLLDKSRDNFDDWDPVSSSRVSSMYTLLLFRNSPNSK
jgi:hypothetical protein